MDTDVHPKDIIETAEAYLMGRLTPEERGAYEKHFIVCRQCAERLKAVEEFRREIRRAAVELLLLG